MRNFTVGAKGNADATVEDKDVTLGEGRPLAVPATGGTAIVIHAKGRRLYTEIPPATPGPHSLRRGAK